MFVWQMYEYIHTFVSTYMNTKDESTDKDLSVDKYK